MPKYSTERKAAVMQKLLPPNNQSVAEGAKTESITQTTLYTWRKQAKEQGVPVPGSKNQTDNWSPQAKFATVVETASFHEIQNSEYCRQKGLYPEQLQRWKQACIDGAESSRKQQQSQLSATKKDKQRIKALERELQRKEKALAETAALLVLRKKFNALWGENEGFIPRT